MAKTIPQLTDATTVNAADELIIQQGGITKRATGAELAKGLNAMYNVVNIKDFGAVGDNITDDTAAINAAIAHCNARTIPTSLMFPSGFFRITSALTPITSATVIEGDSIRGTILFPSGNFDVITFKGVASRQFGGGIKSLLIDCQQMTGGIAVTLDWTQDFIGEFYIANAHNGIYVRQSGNTRFDCLTIDKSRGEYCFKAFGSNTSRNGENDQCDVIAFGSDSTFTGTYVPGVSPTPTTTGVILDGRVHTVNFGNLRLLALLRGFVCTNSQSLPQKFVPSFIYGNCIETENTYAEGLLLTNVNVVETALFVGSVTSEAGVKMTAGATRVTITSCNIESCWQSGIVVDGSIGVNIYNPSIWRNNVAAQHPSNLCGIEIVSGDNIVISGGQIGRPSWDSSYAEQQEYGIINVGATHVKVSSVDLRNNYTAASAGDIYFQQCVGSVTIAPASPSVGASPWTYTAGYIPEVVSVQGGTVSQIAVESIPLFLQTNQLFVLQPYQSAVITYSSAPTVRSLKMLG
jgi:hypothetical protein